MLLFFLSLKGSTLRRRSLRLFLVKSYPREKYFHRDINNLARGWKIVKKCGWKEVIEKLSSAEEASFRGEFWIWKRDGKEVISLIFQWSKRIVLIITLEDPRGIKISVFHFAHEDHFSSHSRARSSWKLWSTLDSRWGTQTSRWFNKLSNISNLLTSCRRREGMYTSIHRIYRVSPRETDRSIIINRPTQP